MTKRFFFSLLFLLGATLGALAGIDDLPTTVVDGHTFHYYDVEPKQTVYSICRELGITKAQLFESNPDVAEHGLKAYQRLLFPAAVSASKSSANAASAKVMPAARIVPATPAYKDYVVRERETFYSIAHSHGISVAELEEANPGVAILRAGMTLRIPSAPEADNIEEVTDTAAADVVVDGISLPVSALPAAPEAKPEDVTIALILPFMLDDAEPSRRSELMTEFYKGFLIAADSLRHSPLPINILAYDTANRSDSLTAILARPELADADVIIAPDNAAHLETLARYGQMNGIDVMNLFVVADRSYTSNPRLFQATIPHDAMYTSAIGAMTRHFEEGLTPVIVVEEGVKGDKQNFVDQLTALLSRKGIDYETITYSTALTQADLADLADDGRYAFIPTSAKQSDLNRILPALIEKKQRMSAYDPIRLYGYPEWTTFRGETLQNMHALNTYVYSRFFTSPDDPWARRVEEQFERWYGTPMAAAVPRQGLLGFDTGMFLIKALSRGVRPADAGVYHGVQNAFRFVSPRGTEGYVNDDLYFVNFRPSGLTDRISL